LQVNGNGDGVGGQRRTRENGEGDIRTLIFTASAGLAMKTTCVAATPAMAAARLPKSPGNLSTTAASAVMGVTPLKFSSRSVAFSARRGREAGTKAGGRLPQPLETPPPAAARRSSKSPVSRR
jgi:hypothetical protein